MTTPRDQISTDSSYFLLSNISGAYLKIVKNNNKLYHVYNSSQYSTRNDLSQFFCKTKVTNFDSTLAVLQQDVICLDISMDNAVAMHV